DRDRFRGSCYRAANWRWVGQTQGRSRQDRDHQRQVPVKDVYFEVLNIGCLAPLFCLDAFYALKAKK
ncbi:MAG: DUF4338 domain-containing protein, partial [Verrucomicrobia bacterium]|nr:DUF4338 domain-containing protein [Verrucomicrobiota bacterium]